MNPEIKNRIAKIKVGGVPGGYKKTKIGIVPQEWKPKQISKYLNLVERSIKMDDNAEYELVTVRRGFGGVDSRGFLMGREILVKSQFAVEENDFVISKRQIAHGACGIVPEELGGAIVSNEYNVFTGRDNLDVVFFNYFMQLPELKHLFYLMSNGVHIEKLLFKTNDWLKQKICIPSLTEQQQIANILTIWDKGIELKQKLIVEKRAQKKWLMQKLLTGEERLKGFDGKWEKVRLGNLAHVIMGQSPNSDFYNDCGNGLPLIQGNADCVDKKVKPRIWTTEITKKCEIGDIILTVRAPVGAVAKTEYIACIGRGVCAIRSNEKNEYLYHVLVMSEMSWKKLSQGTTFEAINGDDIRNLSVFLPKNKREQTAIAKILSVADREIDLLEKDLTELKQQKKGLMQLLLKGIVRVNESMTNC